MPYVSRADIQAMSPSAQKQYRASRLPLGREPNSGADFFVDDEDRFPGMYVVGKSGYGKSTFLVNCIAFDAFVGNAIIVIDYHGDLTTDCLNVIPQKRMHQTFVLNLEDEGYPFGVNLFAHPPFRSSLEQTQAINRITRIFNLLWPETKDQQYLPLYLYRATLVLLENPDSTLVDMYYFLTDETIRHEKLKPIKDPEILRFWRDYDGFKDAERTQKVGPLIRRLDMLCISKALVKNVVGQRRTSINFRRAIEEKQIIFVKLPFNEAPEECRLLATLLMSEIQSAIFSFGDIHKDHRPTVSLYADEFQNAQTPDYERLLTQGRKFGLRLTIAHQFGDQLDRDLKKAAFAARNIVCFRTVPEDAETLGKLFPPGRAERTIDDVDHHPIDYLLKDGCDDDYAATFTDLYLHPLRAAFGVGRGKVTITDTGPNPLYEVYALIGQLPSHPKVQWPNPGDRLDALLFDCMRTGNWQQPIPWEAVAGFANMGVRSFFWDIKGRGGQKLLNWPVEFPPYLVRYHPNGNTEWLRAPDTGREQLLHLIFYLRGTMRYLAEHPLLKTKAGTSSDSKVAKLLPHLPVGVAFVRSGDDAGTIITNPMPARLPGDAWKARDVFIRMQTRQRYCHKRSDVEAALPRPSAVAGAPAVVAQAPLMRWDTTP